MPPARPAERKYPAVLDCGFGNGTWIERLLQEKNGDVDVSDRCPVVMTDYSKYDPVAE